MKKPVMIAVILGVGLLVCGIWQFYRVVTTPAHSGLEPSTNSSQLDGPGSNGAAARSRKFAGSSNRDPVLRPEYASARLLSLPGFFSVDADAIKKLLKSNPGDSQLLSSAALWSDDPEIWSALREKSSTDPLAAATLSIAAPTPQERLESALSLSKLDPNNGFSYMAAAEASFQLGDREAALEFMTQAAEASSFDIHAAQYTRSQEQILESSGLDEVQRGVLLSKADRWQQKTISILEVLNEEAQKDQSKEGEAENAGKMQDILEKLRNGLGPSASFSAIQQLTTAEEMVLRKLPKDLLMSDNSTTRERARHLGEERINLAERAEKVTKSLETSSYGIAKDYYRLVASKGEVEASKWLLGN